MVTVVNPPSGPISKSANRHSKPVPKSITPAPETTVGKTVEGELDLNGQRIETSGKLMNNGNLTDGGLKSLAVLNNLDITGTGRNISGASELILNGSGSIYWGATGGGWNTAFFNGGAYDTWAGQNVFGTTLIGSGDLDVLSNTTFDNIKIATGGELDGNSSTLTVDGDFTTSGGLIGKSAYDFNGAASGGGYIDCTANAALEDIFDGGGTVEAWIRIDGDAGTASGMRPFSKDKWFVSVDNDASGDVYKLRLYQFFSGDNGVWSSTNTVLSKDKWHHIAITYNNGATTNDPLLYVDGKQVAITESGTPTGTFDADGSDELYLGNRGDGARTFNGVIGMARIWSDIRDVDELRTNMFDNFANMTTPEKVGLVAMYQFDEGTSTDLENVANAGTADGTITANSSDWAGAGNFDGNSSTLVMAKSGTQKINFLSGEDIGNFTVNDGSTTELHCVDTTSGLLDVYGNVVVNEKLKSPSAGSTDTSLRFREVKTLTVGSDVKTTALSDLYALNLRHSNGTIDLPELTTKRVILASTTNCTARATGDLTITEMIQLSTGRTFNANGNTITSKEVDLNGTGTLNVVGSTLILTDTSRGLRSDSGVTLNGGPGTIISGSSAATTFQSQNNFEIVGKIENLDVTTEELNVTGQVINCTGEIHQWHNTIDSDQQLDRDTADDRDINLGRDLDKNTELVG